MFEGSYGGSSNKFDEGNTMNREATSGLLLETSSSVVANSWLKCERSPKDRRNTILSHRSQLSQGHIIIENTNQLHTSHSCL